MSTSPPSAATDAPASPAQAAALRRNGAVAISPVIADPTVGRPPRPALPEKPRIWHPILSGRHRERGGGRSWTKEISVHSTSSVLPLPLARVLERISDGFLALDREWRIVSVSPGAAGFLGRNSDELVGRHMWTAFPWAVGRPFHRACERAMQEGRPVSMDGYLASPDRWFEHRIYPSRQGLTVYFNDITWRKRHDEARSLAKKAREELTRRNAALVNALGQIAYEARRRTNEVIWSGEFTAVLGYSAAEMGTTLESWTSRVHPLDLKRVLAGVEQAAGEGRSLDIEYRFRHRDGSWRWMRDRGVLTVSNDGALEHIIGVFTDVTGYKQAGEALRESEERLRLALEAAHVGIFDWDVPNDRIAWSRGYEEPWGFAPGDFAGTYASFASRVHPDDLPGLGDAVAHCIAARAPCAREFRVVWPDGSVRWVSARGEFTFDQDGRPLRMRGTVVETTEQRRAEEQIRELAAALRALSTNVQTAREEEAARIARELHDELGQALTGIKIDLAWLDSRLSRAGGAADVAPLRERTAAAIRQVDAAIQDVRRISTELRPSVLDDLGIVAAIEWQAQEFEARTGIPCVTSLPAELPPIDAPRATALYRVLMEALTNVARHAGATRVHVTLALDGGAVTLDVRDNGRGIAAEAAASPRSIGLLGMRERARVFGGTVTVAPLAPRGTRVHVEIPLG
ncbi:MAG: hypothetical protein A3G77_05465 [Acidobacteria bacterium RIFCSPLOWO2_12_FULL_68_19]|nr:MAG: hypothetical protein A3G77_05465 [Acidobacteria bacterium RIFCSPLOWO2_12_FULL_68_19]